VLGAATALRMTPRPAATVVVDPQVSVAVAPPA
jgi:hypothetical protein